MKSSAKREPEIEYGEGRGNVPRRIYDKKREERTRGANAKEHVWLEVEWYSLG